MKPHLWANGSEREPPVDAPVINPIRRRGGRGTLRTSPSVSAPSRRATPRRAAAETSPSARHWVWDRPIDATTHVVCRHRRRYGRIRGHVARPHHWHGEHYVRAGAKRLPFRDATFELATIASAIHWLDADAIRSSRKRPSASSASVSGRGLRALICSDSVAGNGIRLGDSNPRLPDSLQGGATLRSRSWSRAARDHVRSPVRTQEQDVSVRPCACSSRCVVGRMRLRDLCSCWIQRGTRSHRPESLTRPSEPLGSRSHPRRSTRCSTVVGQPQISLSTRNCVLSIMTRYWKSGDMSSPSVGMFTPSAQMTVVCTPSRRGPTSCFDSTSTGRAG